MEKLGLNEIREKFLSFYESKGHLRMPSFSLVPRATEKSLLLINSGMAPLKPYFMGEEVPPRKRATTCQKCIRTPDIERVGKTSRHGTFFEMLGNFSFGDYFKHEATAWAWEFITKEMKMPVDKLYVSVYLDDDEAYDIWTKEIGVAPDHMVRLGREDNFWEIGTGPCGPCSEIYYDRGVEHGCGKPDCAVGCDCDRFVEFWNLVFTQFDSDGKGNYARLEHPNIDTGMGLERLACISQNVDNLFEVDTIRAVCDEAGRVAGVTYKTNEKIDVSLRVITDHIRSTTFLISDGVLPSNEGRGYVLRRLIRRAARHGRLLGINHCFLCELCDVVIDNSCKAYPELAEKREYIKKVIEVEEKRFAATIDQGMSILAAHIDALKAEGGKVLGGEVCFKLSDTFGFPIDLTREILEEQGLEADEEGFAKYAAEQKERSRADKASKGSLSWTDSVLSTLKGEKTEFTGYTEAVTEAEVVAIIKDGELEGGAQAGDEVVVLLNKTCFYGEGGGQVGDSGVIVKDGAEMKVVDTKKTNDGKFLHTCVVAEGSFLTGDKVTAKIDAERRNAIMRNHSSVHLLQAALRKYLGTHIEQAGSYVDEHRARFDFTHFEALTPELLEKVEREVNLGILADIENDIREMPIAEAKALGAMALFGEKYGDLVRVVKMGDVSVELCGGTHVSNTGKIGLFKIVSESSVAAGVRRIESTTGLNILEIIKEKQATIENVAQTIKSSVNEVEKKAAAVVAELRDTQKELESAKAKLALGATDEILSKAEKAGKVTLASASVAGGADALRNVGDALRDRNADVVAMLHSVNEGKATLLIVCGANAVKSGVKAGDLIKVATAVTGGGGGGRPDSAMGSIKDVSKLPEAIEAVKHALEA